MKLALFGAAVLGMAALPARAEEASADKTAATPSSDELDILKRQLAAQEAINAQLRNRIALLEQQMSTADASVSRAMTGLDANAAPPGQDTLSAEANSAIERSLISRGLVLLPQGRLLVTPALALARSGSGLDKATTFASSLTLETGLPFGMAAGVTLPYLWRDNIYGSNNGFGDVSLSLAKRLTNESDRTPAFIVRAGYTIPTGNSSFTLPTIGSGFHAFNLGVSASKQISPVVIYGSLGYSHALAKDATLRLKDGTPLFSGNIQPGDDYSVSGGLSLAATPDISLDAGLSFGFSQKSSFRLLQNGQTSESSRSTTGYMSMGAGFVVAKNLFLNVNSAAGVTDDSADFILSVALPFRF